MIKSVTALLPMKGHSERVPNKNIRLCAGIPLFQYTLSTLLASSYISTVAVNTDCPVIGRLVKDYNPDVIVINRPDHLCGDEVSMNKIIQYDIDYLGEGHYVQTHSTNPLLSVETLDRAVEFYSRNISQYDSIFSVIEHKARFFEFNGNAVNHNTNELIRTQDLPPVYEETSSFYIFSSKSFTDSGKRIGKTPKFYAINKYEALDIDEEEDFLMADLILRGRK